MIDWGAPTLGDRLARVFRFYRACLAAGLIMLAALSAWNIVSWAIWKGDAEVMLYPIFGAWLIFYLCLIPWLVSPGWNPEAPRKLDLLITAILNLPIAILTTMLVQKPALLLQAASARLISGDIW